jgi:hypothetical protein
MNVEFFRLVKVVTTIHWLRKSSNDWDKGIQFREVVEYEGPNIGAVLSEAEDDILGVGLSSRFYYQGGFPFDDDAKLAEFRNYVWEEVRKGVLKGHTCIAADYYWLSPIPDA